MACHHACGGKGSLEGIKLFHRLNALSSRIIDSFNARQRQASRQYKSGGCLLHHAHRVALDASARPREPRLATLRNARGNAWP